jgi:hypothetical protein
MIRLFLIAIFFFTISISNVHAQKRLFHGGLLGGLTLTQVQNDNYAGYNKFGLYFGGYILTEFNDMWIGEVGMNYAGKGSKETSRDENDVYNKYVMRLGYIEFPVIVKIRIQKFDFELGPSFGFLIFSKELDQYGEQQSPTEFKKFELAIIVGVNYMFNEKLGLNLRSQNSILPIRTPNDGVYYTNGQAQYNIVLSLAVRYFMW